MKLTDVLTPSFRALGRQLGLKVELFEGRLIAIAPLWRRAFSTESLFCRALVACGYLTERQMKRAAWRYRLGTTRQGGVIFWQIDQEDVICDGKVMYYRPDCHRDKERHPTWVSTLLCRRRRWADAERLSTRHCFFGLHLLGHTEITESTERLRTDKGHTDCTDDTDLLYGRYAQNLSKNDIKNTIGSMASTERLRTDKGHTDYTDDTDILYGRYAQNLSKNDIKNTIGSKASTERLRTDKGHTDCTDDTDILYGRYAQNQNKNDNKNIIGSNDTDLYIGRYAQNQNKNDMKNHIGSKDTDSMVVLSSSKWKQKLNGQYHATQHTYTGKPVCVVESEKSAVILSEWYPQYVWMATGGMGNVQPERFRGLRGQRVILFPDTDTDGTAYRRWYEAAQVVMQQPFWEESPPIRVSPVLELHASPEQKEAKIDLVDFLFDPP